MAESDLFFVGHGIGESRRRSGARTAVERVEGLGPLASLTFSATRLVRRDYRQNTSRAGTTAELLYGHRFSGTSSSRLVVEDYCLGWGHTRGHREGRRVIVLGDTCDRRGVADRVHGHGSRRQVRKMKMRLRFLVSLSLSFILFPLSFVL